MYNPWRSHYSGVSEIKDFERFCMGVIAKSKIWTPPQHRCDPTKYRCDLCEPCETRINFAENYASGSYPLSAGLLKFYDYAGDDAENIQFVVNGVQHNRFHVRFRGIGYQLNHPAVLCKAANDQFFRIG